jgi:tRNA-dihydrouridine synthase 1
MLALSQVGQSDLPFRVLVRQHGATVVFGEMLMADRFAADAGYRVQAFGARGLRRDDHPFVCQFAANDPATFVAAALEAQALGCDGVDLNLGCPQRRAQEGHYGSFLTDPADWSLCCEIVRAAATHPELSIPITVKMRLQPTLVATLAFARQLASAGASLVSVHGRQRGREDQRRGGAANLVWVAAVVQALAPLGVPVVTNGNVRCPRDVANNLAATGAAGIMVAEEMLRDPAVFARARAALNARDDGNGSSRGSASNRGSLASERTSESEVPSRSVLADGYVALLERFATHAFNSDDEDNKEGTQHAPLRMDDGSAPAGKGRSLRLEVAATASDGAGGNEADADAAGEFERLSAWWTNHEVLKAHLTQLVGACTADNDGGLSRKTFRGANTTTAVVAAYRTRKAAAGAPARRNFNNK